MPDPITKADKAWKAYQKKMADWKKKNPGEDVNDAFDFTTKAAFMKDYNSKGKNKRLQDNGGYRPRNWKEDDPYKPNKLLAMKHLKELDAKGQAIDSTTGYDPDHSTKNYERYNRAMFLVDLAKKNKSSFKNFDKLMANQKRQ